jgi:hypothetical protein
VDEIIVSHVMRCVDDDNGVLYVLRDGARPVMCENAADDLDVVLSRDGSGEIVGITLIGADEADPADWHSHPGRQALPDDIRDDVDSWFASRRP